ncbi:glycolate dehydrogenase [Haematococcus lacustris]
MGRRQLARLLAQANAVRSLHTTPCASQALPCKPGQPSRSLKQVADDILSGQQIRGQAALAAVKTAEPQTISVPVPAVKVDLYGAISVVPEGQQVQEGVYKNMDGHRFEDGRYAAFVQEISSFISTERQYSDPVRTFAYGTDASFYRLNPKLVVKIHNEDEVRTILPIAKKHGVPVTFRAAGTSLSGQALTDSVLLKLSHTGKNFRNYQVHGDGSQITVQPGLIAGEVNRILAAHQRKHKLPVQYKIGPDPSSIDSCMIGGVVANNSSGMCCGVSQNTYHTLKDMRIVLVDGTVLDTADPASCAAFLNSHRGLVDGVVALAARVQADKELTALIRRKFAIKCTTGYSLNALVDFPVDSPIEIIKHLMIGSEGTLGFVSQATYNTVPEWPHKASAFIVFPDVRAACRASAVLRNETAVDAVELFDRASLRECEADDAMTSLVPDIKGADPMAAGLLIECRGADAAALQASIAEVQRALQRSGLPLGAKAAVPQTLAAYPFFEDAKKTKVLWDVRKGLIPIVGGAREPGTSMLIEDVACPVDKLDGMMIDLIDMFQRYGYHDASCFGHALEGNLHLVFSQGFRNKEEVQRFADMMEEMCYIVATKHSGSLKGEHGTGRNVAPFVEMEWGNKAYGLMWELKELFDPDYVLNPGVILNKDPDVHIKNLKPSPAASAIVNRCIECGFCESNCPSRDVTLTPRQRIAVYREMHRLNTLPDASSAEKTRLADLQKSYEYQGADTCAADGMCQEKCPVKINTGDLIKHIRAEQMDMAPHSSATAKWLADHFSLVNAAVPPFLNMVNAFHSVLGPKPLQIISSWLNKNTDHMVPAWNPYMPKGAAPLKVPPPPAVAASADVSGIPRKVVYVPSCVTRMMGPSASDKETASVHEKLMSLFIKAGYEVVVPANISNQCCGMMFNSRGFKAAAASKGAELEQALLEASQGGKLPIVIDTSPCLSQVKASISEPSLRFALYEPVEFIRHFLVDKLEWRKVRDSVAIHVPCSSKKMGIEESFAKLAGLCANEVVPTGIPCCGMAGDRGMRYPELTGASLQHLNLPKDCKDGYSTSRTCEMSLSNHSGIDFRGIVYLVDEATTAKKAATASA